MSVNQMLPSGPRVTVFGALEGAGTYTNPYEPDGVMKPRVPGYCVKYRFPSEPVVMLDGALPIGYVVTVPVGVTRLMSSPTGSVNHRSPSRPAAMPNPPCPGNGNALINLPWMPI